MYQRYVHLLLLETESLWMSSAHEDHQRHWRRKNIKLFTVSAYKIFCVKKNKGLLTVFFFLKNHRWLIKPYKVCSYILVMYWPQRKAVSRTLSEISDLQEELAAFSTGSDKSSAALEKLSLKLRLFLLLTVSVWFEPHSKSWR